MANEASAEASPAAMINPLLDPAALHEPFLRGEPFPHLVIDEFLRPAVADAVADELERTDFESWKRDDHADQVQKRWMDLLPDLPPTTAEVLSDFNEPEVLRFFEQLTGINELRADPSYLGGGVHVTGPGGLLSVHADFNIHPATGFHRRINALLYLNRDWDPAWHGELELWPQDLSAPAKVVEPLHNRLVVFRITDSAFHGVPQPLACPPGRQRISLALYYYTEERPEEEKGPFHWAAWQRTGSA